jgi:hypothetical protein
LGWFAAVSSGTSFVLASILSILLFSGMQMYKHWLAASQVMTIFGGYLGSVLFVLSLTVSFFHCNNYRPFSCLISMVSLTLN